MRQYHPPTQIFLFLIKFSSNIVLDIEDNSLNLFPSQPVKWWLSETRSDTKSYTYKINKELKIRVEHSKKSVRHGHDQTILSNITALLKFSVSMIKGIQLQILAQGIYWENYLMEEILIQVETWKLKFTYLQSQIDLL